MTKTLVTDHSSHELSAGTRDASEELALDKVKFVGGYDRQLRFGNQTSELLPIRDGSDVSITPQLQVDRFQGDLV